MLILILCPEIQFLGIGTPHLIHLLAGILFQLIKPLCVIEKGCYLILYYPQMRWLIVLIQKCILPLDDIHGSNLIHLLLTKIRNNLGFKQYPLRHDGTLLQPRCLILKIHLHKGSKFHIHAGTLPLQEFPFPPLSIFLGGKSTLHLGLILTEPVLIVTFAIPGVSFLSIERRIFSSDIISTLLYKICHSIYPALHCVPEYRLCNYTNTISFAIQ